jgi:hypothetical protein
VSSGSQTATLTAQCAVQIYRAALSTHAQIDVDGLYRTFRRSALPLETVHERLTAAEQKASLHFQDVVFTNASQGILATQLVKRLEQHPEMSNREFANHVSFLSFIAQVMPFEPPKPAYVFDHGRVTMYFVEHQITPRAIAYATRAD